MLEKAVVITTIFEPSRAVRLFASLDNYSLVVVGDRKTPKHWEVPGATFLPYGSKKTSRFAIEALLPDDHYSRKNLGYLVAIREGASVIVDSDDDNVPIADLCFPPSEIEVDVTPENLGFVNVYHFFSDQKIWPRGLPLSQILRDDSLVPLSSSKRRIGVWQSLADGSPDVDALYRLTDNSECTFARRAPVVAGRGTWIPFNSQCTMFVRELFPLLYLPATVSFRFTDILRGLVAQPIMWSTDYLLGFTSPLVRQDRNPHDILADFQSEIPMYLGVSFIPKLLTTIVSRESTVLENLWTSYVALCSAGIVSCDELEVLGAWISDCRRLGFV